MEAEKKDILKKFFSAFGWHIVIIVIILILVGMWAWRHYTTAATVNNSPISRLDVIKELESVSGESALDALVVKKLIAQKATEAGITVDQKAVESEMQKIEEQIKKSGASLDQALAAQGMTQEKFKEQLTLQQALKQLLGDKLSVSDDDAKKYIADNKITLPQGTSEEDFIKQVKEQLSAQKLGTAAQEWIAEQKKNAKIQYFVPYAPIAAVETPAEAAPATSEQSAPAPEAQK